MSFFAIRYGMLLKKILVSKKVSYYTYFGFLYTKENRAHWAASGAISDFLLTKGCVIAYTGQKAEMPRVQRHLYKRRSLANHMGGMLDFGLKWLHLK